MRPLYTILAAPKAVKYFIMRDLSPLLKKALSPERLNLIRKLAATSAAMQMRPFIVGGFVRDLLLGRASQDFDLVVEGDAIRLARRLARELGGKVTAHARFGTASWLPRPLDGAESSGLDLASARAEIYRQPAVLPTVAAGDLADDLRRRDFTINTLAICLDAGHFGQLRDDLGGERDLERGLVRVLHPQSFIDDPTRMLRAVRYEQRYGFHLDPETQSLVPGALPYVEKLSAQRLRHELDLILGEPAAGRIITRLEGLDVLKAIHPRLPGDAAARQRLESPRHPELLGSRREPSAHAAGGQSASDPPGDSYLNWLLWLMPLPVAEIELIDRRLHFTAALRKALLGAAALLAGLPSLASMRPSGWVGRLEEIPIPAVYAVSLATSGGRSREMLENYLLRWRHVRPGSTGHDLKQRGLRPGPKYQEILRRLRDAWLDGEVRSPAEEASLLQKIIGDKGLNGDPD
jgi:tRNA nucleotidyltransferase (CCA-adding enzyme)